MKLLRLFVAVLLMAAPTMAYGQTGVPATQIPQGRGAIMYIQNVDGTYSPVSQANPVPGTAGGGDIGSSDDTVCATSTGDCTLIALHKKLNTLIDALNALVAGEVPAGDEEIGKVTPTISNLVRGTITSAMTGTTSTLLLSAPGTGIFNYITNFTCSNMDADTDTVIALQDGNGGTTFYSAPAAKLGGGFAISFPVPLKQPTAATALYVVNETTGATTKCSASGFTR